MAEDQGPIVRNNGGGQGPRWPGPAEPSCYWPTRHAAWSDASVLVPSVYREWPLSAPPPAWLRQHLGVYVYQRLERARPCFVANFGFETTVYMRFVADHYRSLPKHIIFAQADWFATKPRAHSAGLRNSQTREYAALGRAVSQPFDFWQPRCILCALDTWHRSSRSRRAHARVARPRALAGAACQPANNWSHYLPLGKHHSIWPPQFFYNVPSVSDHRSSARDRRWWKDHGDAPAALVRACIDQLLHVDFVRRHEAIAQRLPQEIVHNYYINNNFLVSRERLLQYPQRTYMRLAARFARGLCIPEARSAAARRGNGSQQAQVASPPDSPTFHKLTVGVTMEKLVDSIFGGRPAHMAEGVPGFQPRPLQHWHPSGSGWPLPRSVADCCSGSVLGPG